MVEKICRENSMDMIVATIELNRAQITHIREIMKTTPESCQRAMQQSIEWHKSVISTWSDAKIAKESLSTLLQGADEKCSD